MIVGQWATMTNTPATYKSEQNTYSTLDVQHGVFYGESRLVAPASRPTLALLIDGQLVTVDAEPFRVGWSERMLESDVLRWATAPQAP
jgi:hypothetical protein